MNAEDVLGSFVERPAISPYGHDALLRDLDGIDTRGLEEAPERTGEER